MPKFIELPQTIAGVALTVITHNQPHLDEIGALWLVERFADTEWLRVHCPNSRLELGVLGGEFDEHPNGASKPAEQLCCMELVARSLGVDQRQELAQLLKTVHLADIEGKAQPTDLYNLVKLFNREYPDDPERVIAWTFLALAVKYAEQLDFVLSLEAVEFAQRILVGTADNAIRVMVFETDCSAVMKASQFYDQRRQPDVVVQRKTDGHTMIWTRAASKINLANVAAHLRLAEARVREDMPPVQNRLSSEGFAEPDTTWYYATRGEMILNGSNTAEVEPTRLNLDQVLDCLRRGLELFLAEEEAARG